MTLTATPASGSRFASWGGSCGSGTSTTVTLQVNAAGSCTATFVHTDALTVTKTGDGAGDSLVTSSPSGISCGTSCSATYDSGTSVTLTAEAGEGDEFAGWSGTGCTSGTSAVTVLVNQARTCTAVFAAPPPGCDPGEQSACERDGGTWDSDLCECHYWWEDPLLIPLDGHPIRLTGVRNGVLFDVNGDGIPDRVAWTVPGAPVGFLVLDRNGNGVVDGQGELFGQAVTGQRHPARLRQGYGGSAVAPPSPMGLWRGGGGKVPPTASRLWPRSTGRRTAATATGSSARPTRCSVSSGCGSTPTTTASPSRANC